MTQRIIAVGDMHGCEAALTRLLDEIQLRSGDIFIGLGDYVDRGPNTRGVLDRLIAIEQECEAVFLTGNHELMMRSAMIDQSEREFWLRSGGAATIESYNGAINEIPAAHIEFFDRCVPFHELDEYFFIHANYTPSLPLDQQPDFAMYWEHLTAHMPGPHVSGKTAVVGHTPQRGGDVLDNGHLICLDTYCYGGGWLTALDLLSRKTWQANLHGELRSSESVLENE